MASIEEKVEEYYKAELDRLHIRHYGKTESINRSIEDALRQADSKSGNGGNNYPDIKLLLQNSHRRDIPVMIEAKGGKGKLEKLTKNGDIELISRLAVREQIGRFKYVEEKDIKAEYEKVNAEIHAQMQTTIVKEEF